MLKKFKNNKKALLVLLISFLMMIAILGGSYAVYIYSDTGINKQKIAVGSIEFHYQETTGVGNGIALEDATPISDEDGKSQTGTGKVFDFEITSKTSSNVAIPYEITAKLNGDDISDSIKVYLTRIRNGVEEELTLSKYSRLGQSTNELASGHIEKTLYTTLIPANTSNYSEQYRLRIWVDSEAVFENDPVTVYYCDNNEVDEDSYNNCAGTKTSKRVLKFPDENKVFFLTVNAYANGQLVGETVYLANEIGYSNPLSENCTDDNHTVECAINELQTIISKKEIKKFCELKSGTAETVGSKYECDPGDGTKRNFYVLTVRNKDLDLIMERNITDTIGTTRAMNWSNATAYFKTGAGVSTRMAWTNVMSVDLPSAQAIANAVGNTSWNAATSNSIWWCFGSKVHDSESAPFCNSATQEEYAWLFNHLSGCTAAGCTDDSGATVNGYWTKDKINGANSAWVVGKYGIITYNSITETSKYGVRPIITVSKSNLY